MSVNYRQLFFNYVEDPDFQRVHLHTVLTTFPPKSIASLVEKIAEATDDDPAFLTVIAARMDEHPEEWRPYASRMIMDLMHLPFSILPLLQASARLGVDVTGELNGAYLLGTIHSPDAVRWLLQSGANPNIGSEGLPPLSSYAKGLLGFDVAEEDRVAILESMKLVLAAGADPAYQDRKGDTALHVLLSSMKPSAYEAVCVLMAAGTPVDLQNNKGQTVSDLFQKAAQKHPQLEEQCSEAHLEDIRGQLAMPVAAPVAAAYVSANQNNEKQEGGRRRRRKTRRHRHKKAKKTYRRRH